MDAEQRLLIDGELVAATSGRTYNNFSPVSELAIGVVSDAGYEDMDRAIGAARRVFDQSQWSRDHDFRHHCLTQLKDGLVAAQARLRDLISAETGAPMGICGMSGPHCDVPISFIDHMLEFLPQYKWDRDLGIAEPLGQRSRRIVEKEAIGVVGCITPWNVPLQINLAKCIPALAAGCSVVLKAAPETPWSAAMLGQIVKESTDIPAGVFNVLTAEDPVSLGEQLVKDPRVDMISFTGSTVVGKRVMALASESVKKVFLELGGKSANIILEDSDLSQSLLSSLAVCFHAGQGCAIHTRLLIPKSRRDKIESLLQTYFGYIEYGDPMSETQIMGPLINARKRDRVLEYIDKG
ncbi:MAG: aldehyde dehydrogenase family protein, partial [Halieaceae bacterium]|nr:aldehyde dehydrogenase family protein [Halieaceae bacterium]